MKKLIILIAISILSSQIFLAKENSDNHYVHHNHLAIFSGLTSNLEYKHTDLSVGLDYEYRIPLWDNILGIGLFGEIVFAEHTEYLVGLPIFLHPFGSFKFWAAPGIMIYEPIVHYDPELHKIKNIKTNQIFATDESSGSEQKLLIRIGGGYDFHIKNFSITPAFSADIVDGHLYLVYGIYFGLGF